jgi:quercetin dioxygenase-like cupin family protein
MEATMREEIRVGGMAIRFLVEGAESGGSVAVFEFVVPVGTKVAAGHSHDAYEETIYGLEGVLTWNGRGEVDRRWPRRSAPHSAWRGPPVRQHGRG